MQLLQVAIPALERMVKDGGEEGRKKLASITRYVTIALSLLMGWTYYIMLRSSGVNYVKIQNMLSGHGARVEDVRFASEILGRNVGIKIDGGIKTLAQAEELLAAGATRLGLTATAKIAEEALKNA